MSSKSFDHQSGGILSLTPIRSASHDTIISTIVVALNLTSLAADGPLPTTHRPSKQSFFVEQIAP